LEHAAQVDRVVFFRADAPLARGVLRRLIEDATALGDDAWDLGPMVGLRDGAKGDVSIWASQGHLNILLGVDLSLAAGLGSCFEDVGFVTRDVDRLKLSSDSRQALMHLVDQMAGERPMIGFGNEGESLFVMGPEAVVESFPNTTGGRG
jgi:hypothetical protein